MSDQPWHGNLPTRQQEMDWIGNRLRSLGYEMAVMVRDSPRSDPDWLGYRQPTLKWEVWVGLHVEGFPIKILHPNGATLAETDRGSYEWLEAYIP